MVSVTAWCVHWLPCVKSVFEILKMKSGQNDQVYEMRENGEAKRSKQQKTGQFNQHFA